MGQNFIIEINKCQLCKFHSFDSNLVNVLCKNRKCLSNRRYMRHNPVIPSAEKSKRILIVEHINYQKREYFIRIYPI